jgi:hypothetical protein
MRKVYDWDSGVYLGEISEATETYNVVGNTNEHGLVIGETTFGGVEVLAGTQTDGKIDYGSLIYISKSIHYKWICCFMFRYHTLTKPILCFLGPTSSVTAHKDMP